MKRMYTATGIALLAAMLMAAPSLRAAQTGAELLQKGIYTQETVGDIDGAIRLYQQVIALGGEAREQTAQAQYRLGQCLLRKGSTSEATKAFEKLIADFPEQKELVTAARQQMPAGIKLIPPPWTEGEMTILTLKLPTGLPIGKWVQTIEQSHGAAFVATTRTHAAGVNQFARVEADLVTLKPRSTYFRHTLLGEYRLAYNGAEVQTQATGKEARTSRIGPLTFDNETALSIFRRLPLAEGYSAKLEFLSPLGGSPVSIVAAVTALEDIETPAGKFSAFKVELQPIRQTFWISADARRYPVKMETNGVTGELEEVTRIGAAPAVFHEPSQNVSVTIPSPWLVMKDLSSDGKPYTVAAIFDPEARCQCALRAGPIDGDLRTEIETTIQKRAQAIKNYIARPGSWRARQIGGQEALSVIIDLEANNAPHIEYMTAIKQDKRLLVLTARIPRDLAEKSTIPAEFDSIVESARMQ